MYFSFSFVAKKNSSFILLSNWYVYLHIKSIYPRKVRKERENTLLFPTPFGRGLNGYSKQSLHFSLAIAASRCTLVVRMMFCSLTG